MDGTRTDDGLHGGLLGGLLVEDPAPPPRRRSALLALLGVVAVAVLGAGGWYGTGWLRDRDLRAALALSTTAVVGVVERTEAAQDGRDLVDAVARVPAAREQVERARSRALRTGGDRGSRVVEELDAHDAVLEALLPLEGLGRGPLQAWGRARVPLAEALEEEARARAALDRPAAQERLAALDRLAPALDRVGAPLLQRAADLERARVRDVLGAARRTADLRAAGEVASGQRVAVRRTAGVLPEGEARSAVERCLAVLDAVAPLTGLTGRDVTPWGPARTRLARALDGEQELLRVDDLVRSAAVATERWRVQVAAAVEAQRVESEALAAHTGALRGLASPYSGLDQRLTGLLDTLVAQRVDPLGMAVLADDVAARDRLAGALGALAAPPALAAEHGRVAQAAAGEAAAVRALADALAVQAGLPLLPPAPGAALAPALPMGALVDQRLAATAARAEALRAWDAAAVRTAALVAKRPLPEEPAV